MRGISYFVVTLLLFACLDTTTKYLASRYPVPLLAWVRYLIQVFFMSTVLMPREGTRLFVTERKGLVVLRGLALVVVTVMTSLSLQRMPVAEVTSIQFVAPLLVAVLAGPVLGEKMGRVRALCAVAGFCGVLLVVRPGSNLDPLGVVFVLMAAVANAFYQMLSRALGGTERAVVMLYYSAMAGFACMSALLPWFWHGPQPTPLDYALFLSLGIVGTIAHGLFTLAFRFAPASTLAPLTYLQLLWAGLMGWFVFGQVPRGLTLLGMLIIAAAGAVVALHKRIRG